MNAFDFVVTVALGSTIATVLMSRDVSLADGILAFAVLVILRLAITCSSLRSNRIAGLVKAEPAALLYRGRLLQDAMRAERVLETEVRASLREAGFASPDQVDLVVLQTDGTFSVVAELPPGAHTGQWVRRIPTGRTSGQPG